MSWRKGVRLTLVPEHHASGSTAIVFREIKELLGIPYVPMSFQAFAAYPRFLELLWSTIQPLLGTRELFQLAGRLRAEVYTRVHNYFAVPDFEHLAKTPQLADVLDVLMYADPVLFLLLSAQQQSFDGPVGSLGTPHPAEHQRFSTNVDPLDYDTAPADIRKLYDDMRRLRNQSYVDSDEQALARFPQFFTTYSHALKSVLQSPLYEPSQLAVREAAYSLAGDLPMVIELEYGRMAAGKLSASEITAVVRLTEALVCAMSATLLNITFAKIALEGGNRPQAAIPLVSTPHGQHPKSAA